MVLNDPKSFSIDVEGSTTKQKYIGIFKVRPLLSHRQKLQKDESKRQLLGTLPETATIDAMKTALIFSKVWAHLIEAPSWWKEAANGIDLLDDEPVGMVYDKIIDIETEITGNLEKDGEKAKTELADLKKK
jgi:hypothetical protein